VVVAWSRRPGWHRTHVLAGWSAGLVAAAAGAWAVPTYTPASPTSALIGDATVGLVTLTLVTVAYLRAAAETAAAVRSQGRRPDTRFRDHRDDSRAPAGRRRGPSAHR
jgi:purine-cytosine permease-like protein